MNVCDVVNIPAQSAVDSVEETRSINSGMESEFVMPSPDSRQNDPFTNREPKSGLSGELESGIVPEKQASLSKVNKAISSDTRSFRMANDLLKSMETV